MCDIFCLQCSNVFLFAICQFILFAVRQFILFAVDSICEMSDFFCNMQLNYFKRGVPYGLP